MAELEGKRDEQALEPNKDSNPTWKNIVNILIRVLWLIACVIIHKMIAYETLMFLSAIIYSVFPFLWFAPLLIYIGVPILIGIPIMRRKPSLNFFVWSFIITDIVVSLFIVFVLFGQ